MERNPLFMVLNCFPVYAVYLKKHCSKLLSTISGTSIHASWNETNLKVGYFIQEISRNNEIPVYFRQHFKIVKQLIFLKMITLFWAKWLQTLNFKYPHWKLINREVHANIMGLSERGRRGNICWTLTKMNEEVILIYHLPYFHNWSWKKH